MLAERLFSRASNVYSDKRKNMDPIHLEETLFLRCNKNYWNLKTVHDVIKNWKYQASIFKIDFFISIFQFEMYCNYCNIHCYYCNIYCYYCNMEGEPWCDPEKKSVHVLLQPCLAVVRKAWREQVFSVLSQLLSFLWLLEL